jgi:NAD(P)-dependent dehydrogenase (short-subunit alcohol dehydrogenase family)
LAPFGINVNAILPGSINIPAMQTSGMYTDGRLESILSHIPMKRPGTPEDIAYGALYLASDAASYVTGSILVIDGGWTCGFARDW